jgi:hypothetical protein
LILVGYVGEHVVDRLNPVAEWTLEQVIRVIVDSVEEGALALAKLIDCAQSTAFYRYDIVVVAQRDFRGANAAEIVWSRR